MSVIVIKSETTEYKILVKAGDEELARQDAVKAAISAEEARLSAIEAGESEQVATEKAAQTVEDAAEALVSATDAEAAKNQIVDKAEINITDEGNILRADGTLFKSIPEVEFLRNINAYRKAPDSKFFDNKQLIAWDNFDRPDESPVIESDSVHTYSIFKTNVIGQILDKSFGGGDSNPDLETSALITINPTKNIGLEFSLARTTEGLSFTGIAIVKDNLNYFFFGRANNSNSLFTELPAGNNYRLIAVINGVATILAEMSFGLYPIFNDDGFFQTRLNFVIKYANRGRANTSIITVQSLDVPTSRIQAFATAYNSTFVTPADYNRIVVIANNSSKIYAYKVANLDL
jgi:hypothetical protein